MREYYHFHYLLFIFFYSYIHIHLPKKKKPKKLKKKKKKKGKKYRRDLCFNSRLFPVTIIASRSRLGFVVALSLCTLSRCTTEYIHLLSGFSRGWFLSLSLSLVCVCVCLCAWIAPSSSSFLLFYILLSHRILLYRPVAEPHSSGCCSLTVSLSLSSPFPLIPF